MMTIRAAVALATVLLAAVPALGLRTAEWSIDPRAGVDQGELVGRLQEVLSSGDTGIPPDLPFRIGVNIDIAYADGGFDLLITTTDLDAELPVRSVVRAAPSALLETVVAALIADLGYLHASRAGFPPPIYVPPDITDVIDGQTIADLIRTVDQATGDGEAETDPGAQILDLAAHDGGVSVLLTGGSIELGPHFELTAATPASLLPTALPAGAAVPHEIARTSWTHDMLAAGLDTARILRRRNGESSVTSLELPPGARRLRAVPGGGLIALIRYGPKLAKHGPAYVRLTDHAIEARLVPVATSFITAMDVDHQRRIVLYDPFDRRVVFVGLDGREIGSIRPQVDPRMLPFPHALAVLGDGSVLLGGSGLVLAFDELGRPRWLLVAPRGGRETLPAQFVLEAAPEEDAFYLLDGPRTRILRFSDQRAGESDEAPPAKSRIEVVRQLADLALADAVAAQEWGDLTQANERANLAVDLYEYALGIAAADEESQSGLERAIGVRGDAESVIFQEPFLALSPNRLVIAAAGPRSPVNIPVQVENTGVVARTGVSLLATGVRVPVGRIEPGERVERLVMLDLPDSLLFAQESIAIDVGVVISADEPGGSAPRRMFVTVPLTIPAPPWEQVVAGASSPRG